MADNEFLYTTSFIKSVAIWYWGFYEKYQGRKKFIKIVEKKFLVNIYLCLFYLLIFRNIYFKFFGINSSSHFPNNYPNNYNSSKNNIIMSMYRIKAPIT